MKANTLFIELDVWMITPKNKSKINDSKLESFIENLSEGQFFFSLTFWQFLFTKRICMTGWSVCRQNWLQWIRTRYGMGFGKTSHVKRQDDKINYNKSARFSFFITPYTSPQYSITHVLRIWLKTKSFDLWILRFFFPRFVFLFFSFV